MTFYGLVLISFLFVSNTYLGLIYWDAQQNMAIELAYARGSKLAVVEAYANYMTTASNYSPLGVMNSTSSITGISVVEAGQAYLISGKYGTVYAAVG